MFTRVIDLDVTLQHMFPSEQKCTFSTLPFLWQVNRSIMLIQILSSDESSVTDLAGEAFDVVFTLHVFEQGKVLGKFLWTHLAAWQDWSFGQKFVQASVEIGFQFFWIFVVEAEIRIMHFEHTCINEFRNVRVRFVFILDGLGNWSLQILDLRDLLIFDVVDNF